MSRDFVAGFFAGAILGLILTAIIVYHAFLRVTPL